MNLNDRVSMYAIRKKIHFYCYALTWCNKYSYLISIQHLVLHFTPNNSSSSSTITFIILKITFSWLSLASGGHYAGIDTLKSRFLPWLGSCFTIPASSISADTSLSLMQVSEISQNPFQVLFYLRCICVSLGSCVKQMILSSHTAVCVYHLCLCTPIYAD